jgi:hypothetical protein
MTTNQSTKRTLNRLSIVSLALGIISLSLLILALSFWMSPDTKKYGGEPIIMLAFIIWVCGNIIGFPGILIGAISLAKHRKSNTLEKILAIVGICFGSSPLLYFVLPFIFAVIVGIAR